MQLYAVDFIPLLGSLYMYSSGVQSTATGTNHTIVWFVPVAVDTVENCIPDDGCIKHPKHVE